MPNDSNASGQGWRLDEVDDARTAGPRGSTGQNPSVDNLGDGTQRLLALGEMTAGIAHDFRNILAVIDSGLRLAEKSCSDPARSFIDGAREGVARGSTLTSQLLTFVKQQELQANPTDVNALLKALDPFLRYGAGAEVRVTVELSPHVPDCLVDPTQFNAAMLNLVINARDAMPTGGEVRISTASMMTQPEAFDAAPINYVRVRVRDNGTGMSDEVLQRIFQPLFSTKGERGTGLGLAQVGAFVRGVGGHVRVASDPGQGTTFDLFLPTVGQTRSFTPH
jgi:signal transduction histidine kinase